GQNTVLGRIGEIETNGLKLTARGRHDQTEPGAIGDRQIGHVLVDHFLETGLVGEEEIIESLELAETVGDADADIVQLIGRYNPERLRHKKPLAIKKTRGDIARAITGVAACSPGAAAHEHIDGASLERGKSRLTA